MDYEGLKFRPSSGSFDAEAITTWLAAKGYAFLDPLGGKTWHLSATKEEMEASRRTYLANPKVPMPSGVQVHLLSDFVGMTPHLAHRAAGNALEFLRWLVKDREWMVQVDQSPWEPIGDPARFFPEGTSEPDHTIYDLTEGVRYTWEANERSFVVHSSAQWRTRLCDATEKWRVIEDWHGELSPSAMAEWQAAVAYAGELIEYVEGNDATGSFEIEDLETIDKAWFDAAAIPALLKPLASLVERWLSELARWSEASTSDDLRRVRKG